MDKKLAFLFIAVAFFAGVLSGTVAHVSAQEDTAPTTVKNAGPSGVIELAPPVVKKVKRSGKRYVPPTGPIDIAKYPKRGIIVGEVIELSTYAMYGDRSDMERYRGASRRRADEGFPVGIIEESTGDVYIALHKKSAPASRLGPANAKLSPYMGKRVVAAGLRYRTKGVNVFRISVMSEY